MEEWGLKHISYTHHLVLTSIPKPRVLRPPPGGGGYSQHWSSIRTAKPVGKSGSDPVAGEGWLLFLLPPPQARGGFPPAVLVLSFLPFKLCPTSPPLPPAGRRLDPLCSSSLNSWSPLALQSHLTQPRDLSVPPSHPSWLQQRWAWWPLPGPSFLHRVSPQASLFLLIPTPLHSPHPQTILLTGTELCVNPTAGQWRWRAHTGYWETLEF